MLDAITDALNAPRKFLWEMIPGLHDAGTGEAYSGSQVASNALGLDPESLWAKGLGFGLEALGDPLPGLVGLGGRAVKAGLGLAGKAAKGVKSALGAGPGNVSKMRGVRDQISVLDDFVPSRRVPEMSRGRMSGQAPWMKLDEAGQFATDEGAGLFRQAVSQAAEGFADDPALAGLAFPRQQMVFLGRGASPMVRGHELGHGVVGQAVNAGDARHLRGLSRVAAELQMMPGDFAKGIGNVADEAAQYARESRRGGLLPQVRGAWRFLMNPEASYVRQFAQDSPLAASLYGHFPEIARGLGAGALGAGAAAAAYPFMGE